ncbi:CFEM domain-containing protein [Stachybotrys elegans]|uniref:CFEM domain-containing protein n=1 Tax=Stachybotrys elegans TaxID=80388 RepID=A0A8K0SKW9_9HYPO|nr:CFEM domain-containing protein [Stachybotrys elegans]
MPSLLNTVLFLVAALPAALAQTSTDNPLAIFPECAQPCVGNALSAGLCDPTDKVCTCTDPVFQQNVSVCVAMSCQIPDSLSMRNTSLANCGVVPRDRAAELINVTVSMAVLSGLFVLIRFVYKIFYAQMDLGLDDWMVLATVVFIVPSAAITLHGTTPNGLGRDIWTLQPVQITHLLMFFYNMAYLYFIQCTLLKLSIIAFYMRIFPAQGVQRVLWGTFIFTAIWGITFVFTTIFQCKPINYFWTKWDGLHEGHCADANAITWVHAALSITLDFWSLLIPMWQLRKLHLHWKKKIPVALMFCLGTFITVVSIIRLQSLIHFAATSNVSWEFYDISLWSTIEICVGIITICLPTLRIILVKFFPALSGSSYGSKGAYYNQRSGGSGVVRSGISRSRHEASVAAANRTHPENDADSPTGIRFQKSFAVQYSDNDETSLVAMNDLEQPPKKTWQPNRAR